MKQVNVHEAKSQLSQLLAEAEAGEDVVIARAGKPIVRLTLVAPEPEGKIYREPGQFKDDIHYSDDWDSPAVNAEIARSFFESETDDELFGPPPGK